MALPKNECLGGFSQTENKFIRERPVAAPATHLELGCNLAFQQLACQHRHVDATIALACKKAEGRPGATVVECGFGGVCKARDQISGTVGWTPILQYLIGWLEDT